MLEMIKLLEEDVNAVDTKLNDVKKRLLESSQLVSMINNGTDENNIDAMHRVCDIVINNLNYILVYEYQEFDSMIGKVLVGLEDIGLNLNNINTKPAQVIKNNKPDPESKPAVKRGRKPNSTKESPKVEKTPQTLQDVFGDN